MPVAAFHAMVQYLIRSRNRSGVGVNGQTRSEASPKLKNRLLDVLARTYDLGFTAFGGPPVHFQILHRRFVDGMGKPPWIDEQTVRLSSL